MVYQGKSTMDFAKYWIHLGNGVREIPVYYEQFSGIK